MKRTIPLILIATLTACASTPTTVPLATPYPATATESSTATPVPTTEIAPFYHVSDTLNTGDAYYSFGQNRVMPFCSKLTTPPQHKQYSVKCPAVPMIPMPARPISRDIIVTTLSQETTPVMFAISLGIWVA